MASLYVETNLPASIALGRVPTVPILLPDEAWVGVFLPTIRVMESLSFLEGDHKRRRQFQQALKDQIAQLKRDTTSEDAASLLSRLEQSLAANIGLIQANESRLYRAIDDLSVRATLIGLDPKSITAMRGNSLIEEPTDNLILHCILGHARSNSDRTKALTSENHKDFEQAAVQEAIEDAGIRYFRDVGRAIDWLRSESSGKTGD